MGGNENMQCYPHELSQKNAKHTSSLTDHHYAWTSSSTVFGCHAGRGVARR